MAEKNKYTPESFVKEYAPIAQRIGDQIDVDPAILLAKFGLETGWGKSVIPNSYNLGNIKDFSGSGISAVDNSTKKADKYVQFQDPEVFADYYVDLIQRLYPNAIGAKSDMDKFAAGLVGPKGSYNEKPEKYAKQLNEVYGLVTPFMQTKATAEEKNPFDTGKTEAEKIAGEPPPSEKDVVQTNRESDLVDAALMGGTAGLAKGAAEKFLLTPEKPVGRNVAAAQEKLSLAQDKFAEVQKNLQSGASVADLEKEFTKRQGALALAEAELKAAEAEAKALSGKAPVVGSVTTSLEEGAPGRASGAKEAGASGTKNWLKQAAGQEHQVPEAIQNRATDMTKSSETGAKKLIEQDLKNLEKIKQLGGGDMKLTEAKPGQLMVPSDIADERAAKFEKELAEKQAKEALERQRLIQAQEQQRLAAENRVRNAQAARKQAGTATGNVGDQLKQARTEQKLVTDAQSGVNIAQKAAARANAEQPSFWKKAGYKAAKSPMIANTLGGVGTGLSVEEAVSRYNSGDTSGAVLATIEAALGAMSMTPPVGPAAMAVKGIGTVGGLGMIPIGIAHDYIRKRGPWAEDAQP